MPDGTQYRVSGARVLGLGVNWFAAGSGGLDRVFYELAQALPPAGVDFRGLVLGPANVSTLTEGRVTAFGQTRAGLAGRLWGARRAVAEALAAHQPDVVAAHFALFAAPALDVLSGQRVVIHFHGPWADEAAAEGAKPAGVALRRQIERVVYRRAARVVTLSHAFSDLVQARYGVRPEKVRVVPGCVDLARFSPSTSRTDARLALGWPTRGNVVLAVRRLVRRMGLDRLIEAMPAVCAVVPDVALMVGGRGAEEARLRALAASCGVADKIRFLGFVPEEDLALAYRAADINVVPSRALEGFGLTAAEALAAGTPSLVTPVGGLPEVVSPLSNSLVFAGCAPADIAAGLIAALKHGVPNDELCISFARRAFAPARMAADIADLYAETAACPLP